MMHDKSTCNQPMSMGQIFAVVSQQSEKTSLGGGLQWRLLITGK